MMRLWYKKPAEFWEEALPLGNGRLGAMVFSGPEEEKILLNDDTLWSGYPGNYENKGAAETYRKARELAWSGQYKAAQDLLEESFLGPFTESYLPLGTLLIRFPGEGETSDYYRELDLESATLTASYRKKGVSFLRRAYVSAPAGVLVLEITADRPGQITCEASLTGAFTTRTEAYTNRLILEGVAPSHVEPDYIKSEDPVLYEQDPCKKGMKYCAVMEIRTRGGMKMVQNDKIRIAGADQVTFILGTQTSYNGPFAQPYTEGREYLEPCLQRTAKAAALPPEQIYEEHVKDYRSIYGKVRLQLGGSDREKEKLPTDERLKHFTGDDSALIALLYQYGRYLLIASSRKGTLPANLQGIWNDKLRAPWSSNYTLNINTEMNYWPVDTANCSELFEPLLSFIHNLMITGEQVAGTYYGAEGFVAHHNSDIWCLASPVGKGLPGSATYAYWPLSAGWLGNMVYDHFLFTLDTDYLKNEAYPVLCKSAEFFLNVLKKEEDGTNVFAPSTSPENWFIYENAALGVCKTTTMTTAIMKENFRNVLDCGKRLGVRDDFLNKVENALAHLPEYRIGREGELLEWDEPFEEMEKHHRHMSHLYPLFPGREITVCGEPRLADACKKVLERRGDESTGWALAWRICLWARLHEGEHAYEILKKQLRHIKPSSEVNYAGGGGSYPNLFGAHPPFQIDSNFGAVAGITEMFLQSEEEKMDLLPALPLAFGEGFISGLRARGGYEVTLSFKSGALIEGKITSTSGETVKHLKIRYRGKEICKALKPLQTLVLTAKDFE